jgi:hypothetical protein
MLGIIFVFAFVVLCSSGMSFVYALSRVMFGSHLEPTEVTSPSRKEILCYVLVLLLYLWASLPVSHPVLTLAFVGGFATGMVTFAICWIRFWRAVL